MSRRGKVLLASGVGVAVVGGLIALAFSGDANAASSPAPQPQPDPKPVPQPAPAPQPQPKPQPAPQPQPAPKPQPAPGAPLEFDLETNWGGIPMATRANLARIELAAGIPGLGRALAVKAWQAFRAGKDLVPPAEAAAIAAANPDLCRNCKNEGDAAPSASLLKMNTDPPPAGNGWAKPTDYAGWAAASYGLFDILGATAVHAGIHQGKFTPLLTEPSAATAMRRWEVQGFVAAYVVWRFLYSTIYDVLVPGANAPAGNSFDTWANIFTAWATPDGFIKNTATAQAVRARYIERAAEIGIDLSKVAYPWPPGTSYKPAVWVAKTVWDRMNDYFKRPVEDLGGGGEMPAPPDLPPQDLPPPPDAKQLGPAIMLPGGLVGFERMQSQDPLAPLVVVFHGRGGDETAMLDMIPTDLPARVVFMRGAIKNDGGGFLFFEPSLTSSELELVPAIRQAGSHVVAALRQLQAQFPTTQVFAVGFSQGAAIAEHLAELGAVDGIYAHAGGLPSTLRPTTPAAVKVWQWHGVEDKVVPFNMDKATATSFTMAGYPTPVFNTDPKGGHRAPKAAEVMAAIGPQIGKSLYSGDSGIIINDGDCAMTITDPGLATVALSTKVVEAARQLGGVFTPSQVKDLVETFLGDIAPYCLLTSKPWADAASATGGYWAIRAMLRALVTRGFMKAADAVAMLSDVRDDAIQAGASAADLLPLAVT